MPILDQPFDYSPRLVQGVGSFIPSVRPRSSPSKAMQAVTPGGTTFGSVTLEQHVRAQLMQPRRRHFIFGEIYRTDTWVRACIEYIVKRATRGKDRLVDTHDPFNPDIKRLEAFYKACHPLYTFKDFNRRVTRSLLVYNQGYIWVRKNGKGDPIGFYPMDARIVFPVTDLHGEIIFHAQVWNGQVSIYMPDEVIYHYNHNDESNPNGVPTLETLVKSVTMEAQANEFNLKLFENDLQYGSVFGLDDVTPEQINEIKAELLEQYATPQNAHLPLLLGNGTKLLRDGAMAMKDIEFEKLVQQARLRVCADFNVAETLIGVGTNANRSIMDAQERTTDAVTVLPLREMLFEQHTKQFIHGMFKASDVYLDAPLSAKLLTPAQLEGVSKSADTGTYTFNDIREMQDQPRVPNGDVVVMKSAAGSGGFVRPDYILPGLGDPHFDMVAYQLLHEQEQQEATAVMMESQGTVQPPPSAIPYAPPRPQDQIQREPIAARIVDVSRSIGSEYPDEVSRRTPRFPGTRGGKPYQTKSGKIRYGTPPKDQRAPLETKTGALSKNDLTNPRDPSVRRLDPQEQQAVVAAHASVENLYRQAQAENWENEQFMDALEKSGWERALGTLDQFYDRAQAYAECRRLMEQDPQKICTLLGADGAYFIMENDIAAFKGDPPQVPLSRAFSIELFPHPSPLPTLPTLLAPPDAYAELPGGDDGLLVYATRIATFLDTLGGKP